MTLVLIEMCHVCSRYTLCYDHICDKCLSEQEINYPELKDEYKW